MEPQKATERGSSDTNHRAWIFRYQPQSDSRNFLKTKTKPGLCTKATITLCTVTSMQKSTQKLPVQPQGDDI